MYVNHDDVIKWKHFTRYWPFVRGIHPSPMDSPHKVQWSGAFMFSLICSWTNGWANNRDIGDSRRHRAHYDVTGMQWIRGVCACVRRHISQEVIRYSDTANLRFNCLFNTLSRLASKETSKLHITGPLWRESSPHKRTSNQVSMSCMASSCYHGAYWWICTVRYQAICRCSKEANVLYLHGGGTWEMQLILVIFKFISSRDILSIFWEMYPQVNACSQDLYEN